MQKLTAINIIEAIKRLPRNTTYSYISPKNKGFIQICGIESPEGPIRIRRWDPSKGETPQNKKEESISSELIWRIANAFAPGQPINFDRVLGGSYNTRSVLEALMVCTPEFYYCYPGRIENKGGVSKIKHGHKHVIWRPDQPHKLGAPYDIKTDIVISEFPRMEAFYESLSLPEALPSDQLDIDIQRRHAQIQIALYYIGKQLGLDTWIAQNDKGIVYQGKKLGEYEGVIYSLKDQNLLASFDEAAKAASLIDCIWFKEGRFMPAVMEVEHSTGVTSGLSRMKNFKDKLPSLMTRYVIVAADEDRDKVLKEANKEQFRDLNARFFPYSAVEELYALCQKRKLKGITEEFLDCYMEPIVVPASASNLIM